MTFIEKLDLLMDEHGLNKHTLSKACGIPYTTIDGWYKKGYEGLKVTTLKKLTQYFGKTLEYWLEGGEDDDIQETAPAPESERELSDVDRQLIALPVEMKHTILELIEQSVLLGLSDSAPTRQASETTSRSVASQILAAADDQPESNRKDRQAH